jgi:hypothetical protein
VHCATPWTSKQCRMKHTHCRWARGVLTDLFSFSHPALLRCDGCWWLAASRRGWGRHTHSNFYVHHPASCKGYFALSTTRGLPIMPTHLPPCTCSHMTFSLQVVGLTDPTSQVHGLSVLTVLHIDWCFGSISQVFIYFHLRMQPLVQDVYIVLLEFSSPS